MRGTSVSSMNRFGLQRLCSFGVAALCVFVVVGQANGQEPTPASKSKPKPKASAVLKPNVTPTVKGERRLAPMAGRTALRAPKGKPAAGKTKPRLNRKVKFKMNPDAKWACDILTVTREPVWKKSRNLTFEFSIRNEGTADLKIKGKGG